MPTDPLAAAAMTASAPGAGPPDLVTRLWAKDATLWPELDPATITSHLGWLEAPEWMAAQHAALQQWARAVVESGAFTRMVLLGMGGASLSAEVFHAVFGHADGYLPLYLLDTTAPAQIDAVAAACTRTLFIVASKSGTTIETLALCDYFFQRVRTTTQHPAGQNFIAITDPDSPFVARAQDYGFRHIFYNPANMGGRYGALSYFGLVPAALMGVDLAALCASTEAFCRATRTGCARAQVLQLATLMARRAKAGQTLMRVDFAPPFCALGLWLEQLVAESTGKQGKGIIPLCGDGAWPVTFAAPQATATHAILPASHVPFIVAVQAEVATARLDSAETRVADESPQPPAIHWSLHDRYQLGGEFMRWQMATALAASQLAVNPFDQPAVEQTKQYTRQLLAQNPPAHEPHASPMFPLCLPYCTVESPQWRASPATLAAALAAFHTEVRDTPATYAANYVAIIAYLPMFPAVRAALQQLAKCLADAWSKAVTIGFGPRYLHSTGQMHKDGPVSGCFIQIIEATAARAPTTPTIPIPNRPYDFAQLHRAQADGDYAVLARGTPPLVRISLKGDRIRALTDLVTALNDNNDDNNDDDAQRAPSNRPPA